MSKTYFETENFFPSIFLYEKVEFLNNFSTLILKELALFKVPQT